MENLESKTVGEVVSQNFRAADIFKRYGIDFCCGGKRSVKDACASKGVNLDDLMGDLSRLEQNVEKASDFDAWSLDVLIDYILDTHHSYVAENIPLIIQYSDKVAVVHGSNKPEFVKINELFHEVAQELQMHMRKEEHILFPFIKQMAESKAKNLRAPMPPFGTVANPISMMEHEHDVAGDILKQIAKLTNGYVVPQDACNTVSVLIQKLEEFETDLHKHVHLENNILFPKAIELESELSTSRKSEKSQCCC